MCISARTTEIPEVTNRKVKDDQVVWKFGHMAFQQKYLIYLSCVRINHGINLITLGIEVYKYIEIIQAKKYMYWAWFRPL